VLKLGESTNLGGRTVMLGEAALLTAVPRYGAAMDEYSAAIMATCLLPPGDPRRIEDEEFSLLAKTGI